MTQTLEQLKQWIGRREPSADGKSAKLWAGDDNGALALNATGEFC